MAKVKRQIIDTPRFLDQEVVNFAIAMQYKLNKNKRKDGKNKSGKRRRGWKNVTPEYLVHRLSEEFTELVNELSLHPNNKKNAILTEAADVGNMAMMIASRLGNLRRI